MTSIKQLSQEEIINAELIKKLRETIHAKYPQFTSKQKASKLAMTIYDIIEHSLPHYSRESKRNVKDALLQYRLTGNSLTISVQDIVNTSLAIVSAEELQAKLPNWLEDKVGMESSELETYVSTLLTMREKAQTEVAAASSTPFSKLSHPSAVKSKQKDKKSSLLTAIVCFFIVIPLLPHIEKPTITEERIEVKKSNAFIPNPLPSESTARPFNALPQTMQYQSINKEELRIWLNERDSILADEPYFSTIVNVAAEFNIHPFLLFAITGQEQGFVPRTHKHAKEIANNPYNVFHSWQDFNTDILQSTQIAARTVVNLSENRPIDIHPVKWINRKYAEDPNWWKGVSAIFEKLVNEVE